MTAHRTLPSGLTGREQRDYLEAQNDHDELMQQVNDREALIENGLIDSYSDYSFTWD